MQSSLPPFVLPLVVYMAGATLASAFDRWYPLAYSFTTLATLIACVWLLKGRGIIRPHLNVATGVLVGGLGIVVWIWVSGLHLEDSLFQFLPRFLRPDARVGYNPFFELDSATARWVFIAIRLVGISVAVPIAEELFWRGFLLRWFINEEFEKVPLGTYSLQSLALVTLFFTLAHPELFAAAFYNLLITGLLYWKRDLWQCIVAHAVSNFLLVVYVLQYKAWWLW